MRNRTSSHRSSTYGYQSFNRLVLTQAASYTYDANGSMTSRTDANGVMNFNHESDGRLWSAYNNQLDFDEYRYDALGRRIYGSDLNGNMTTNQLSRIIFHESR